MPANRDNKVGARTIFCEFELFCILMYDLYQCFSNAAEEKYDVKFIAGKVKELFIYDMDINQLWRISCGLGKVSLYTSFFQRANSFIDFFAKNPTKFEEKRYYFSYLVIFLIIEIRKQSKASNSSGNIDNVIPLAMRRARRKLNHTLIFQKIMEKYHIKSSQEWYRLLEQEAGVDIFHVSVDNLYTYLHTGISDRYFVMCMDSVLCSMSCDFPDTVDNRRWAVFFLAFIHILREAMQDLGEGDDVWYTCLPLAAQKTLYVFPELFSILEVYGYKLSKLISFL